MTKEQAIKALQTLYTDDSYVMGLAVESKAREVLGDDEADRITSTISRKTLKEVLSNLGKVR